MKKDKLKIAIITQAYFPIHGGLSEHVYHTAHELVERGHDVRIITAYFDRGDENWNWDGRVIRIGRDLTIPSNGAFVNLTFELKMRKHLKQIEREHHFDIIHIHQPDPILPLVAISSMESPKVGTFHTYKQGGSRIYDILHKLVDKRIRRLDARIAVSEAARSYYERYFPGDYSIIPNGVSLKRFRPDHEPIPKLDDGMHNILFVGRLDPRKGVKFLLRAWPMIAEANQKARLVIVGGGAMKEYYDRFFVKAYRDRIFWEGYASKENLPRYYASAHVYCAPSIRGESFGIVLLEAMASGAPIVASNITGYNSVVRHDREAILVPPRDPLALSKALIGILKDTKMQERLKTNGLKRVKEYAWPRVTDRIEQIYRSVL